MSCVQEQPTGDPRSQLREKEFLRQLRIVLAEGPGTLPAAPSCSALPKVLIPMPVMFLEFLHYQRSPTRLFRSFNGHFYTDGAQPSGLRCTQQSALHVV